MAKMTEGEDKSQISDSSPKTGKQLFNYILEDKPPVWKTMSEAAFWKQFFLSIFTSFGSLVFIPSIFADQEELAAARARGRTLKIEAGAVSVLLHVAAILLFIFFVRAVASKPAIIFFAFSKSRTA